MKKLLLAIASVLLFTACKDVFETDISGKQVTVIAPTDNAEVAEGTVAFLWNTLDGAERYRVTIVSPNFGNAAVAIKDTIIYPDSLALSVTFRLRMPEAKYQWSVQAFNLGYESLRTVYDLTVKQENP